MVAVQWILTIHGFHICKFTYSLEVVCSLKSVLTTVSLSFGDMRRAAPYLNHSIPTLPAEVEKGNTLTSYFSSYIVSRCPFHSQWSAAVFTFLCFLLEIPCFRWPPSTVLHCCFVFLIARRLWCAFWRKCVCSLSFIPAWVIALSTMNSMLMDQQCLLKKYL